MKYASFRLLGDSSCRRLGYLSPQCVAQVLLRRYMPAAEISESGPPCFLLWQRSEPVATPLLAVCLISAGQDAGPWRVLGSRHLDTLANVRQAAQCLMLPFEAASSQKSCFRRQGGRTSAVLGGQVTKLDFLQFANAGRKLQCTLFTKGHRLA